ncbi:MAG: glycosyltransferase family 52, partial [Cetobacterium sp.]
ILFTQPLSEDNIITEEEKIEIYLKIIKKYPKDRLIIKTHPREKTNYKNIFKEYLVLDNPFPFEILNILDVKFNKAITLFSTAALGLGKEVEVDFYGTEVHIKILERFSSCDSIMKRNCFLEEE